MKSDKYRGSLKTIGKNIFRVPELESIREAIDYGTKSNYPACCIFWYVVRNYILFRSKNTSRFLKYQKIEQKYQRHHRHVLCPYHLFVDKSEPIYFFCKECDWQQYNKSKCNLCGSNLTQESSYPFYRKFNPKSADTKGKQ